MTVWVYEDEYLTRAGIEVVHCISCHEDANEGYPICEMEGDSGAPFLSPGEVVAVCCAVMLAVEGAQDGRQPVPQEGEDTPRNTVGAGPITPDNPPANENQFAPPTAKAYRQKRRNQ